MASEPRSLQDVVDFQSEIFARSRAHRLLGWLLTRLSSAELPMEQRARRSLFGVLLVVFSTPLLLGFAAFHFTHGHTPLAVALSLSACAMVFSAIVLPKIGNALFLFWPNMILLGAIFLHLLLSSSPWGHQGLWIFVLPSVAYFLLGIWSGLIYTVVLQLSVIGIFVWTERLGYSGYSPEFALRFALSLSVVATMGLVYEFIRTVFHDEMLEKQRQLIDAEQVARRANEAKSRFMASMSHELRTPMHHILGFTEIVADGQLGELNEAQKGCLSDVLASSTHLLSLINDVLDLARIDTGNLELALSDINLKELLADSVRMMAHLAEKNTVSLTHRLDTVPTSVVADARRLRQVLDNVLTNAIKFTPAGGQVMVEGTLSGGRRPGVVISVKDSGIGLANEDKERIFQPFVQLSASLGRGDQGAGLGLAMSRRIVELHGGKIRAESPGPAQGTTVIIELPTRPGEPDADDPDR